MLAVRRSSFIKVRNSSKSVVGVNSNRLSYANVSKHKSRWGLKGRSHFKNIENIISGNSKAALLLFHNIPEEFLGG